MSKVIQCPWLASDGLSRWCMNGRFPCDCEACTCTDKKYVETHSSTTTYQTNKAVPSTEESMAELEEKIKLFSKNHKGKSGDELLAEMRGEEPGSEELVAEIKKYTNQILQGDKDNYTKSFVASLIDNLANHFYNMGFEEGYGCGANNVIPQ